MAENWTREQQAAIDTRNCDLLVAAAAGSGKTAVLVKRIITMICEKDFIDIDKLLIVTFTNAAASEMRQRIADAVTKKINEDPDNEHIKRQLTLLNKATITTIHSFCLEVIRNNFNLIDLDPQFRIADDAEIALIKSEALADLFDELYLENDNESFYDLIECYTENLGDTKLQQLILTIFNFVQGSPFPLEWLTENAEKFNIEDAVSIDDLYWVKIIKSQMEVQIKGAIAACKRAKEICDMPFGPVGYKNNILDDYEILLTISNIFKSTNGFDDLYQAFSNITFSRLGRVTTEASEGLKEEFKKIRDNDIKKVVEEIRNKILFTSPAEMKEDIQNLYPIIRGLSDIVNLFGKKFKEYKKKKNVVDFNDLEHFCLEILLEEGSTLANPISSKVALELQKKYDEILIDEYQDSNLVQELILFSVSKSATETPNRFMVGDIKQSIYKFRLARPELFMDKYNNYEKEVGLHQKIDLFKNFRSRDCVLNSVNYLFYQLMTNFIGETFYDENAALYYGAHFPETDQLISNESEINIICKENKESDIEEDLEVVDEQDEKIEILSDIELEAKFIADRIKKMIEVDKLNVLDKTTGEYRNVQFKDIVILLRTTSKWAEIFCEQLMKCGITAFSDTSSGYFETIEVMTMLSLLQIIDNPQQDVHLITVLHSPMYCVSSDGLTEIKSALINGSFYDCVKAYISKNEEGELYDLLSKFMVDLDKFREEASYTSISELISILYDETNYFNYVGAINGGEVRQANLRALWERAVQFENTSYKGVFNFLRYIEKVQNSNVDIGSAKMLSENENLVKIMSIHKSKGLEFPVVFVSGMGKGFNFQDIRKDMLMHQDLGFGPTFIDYKKRVKRTSVAKICLSKKMIQETLSEELRILYVALTRAKEKLIITGVVKNVEKQGKKWCSFVNETNLEIPSFYMIKAKNFFDFIMPPIARHRDGEGLRDIADVGFARSDSELYHDKSNWDVLFHNANDIQVSSQEKENDVRYEEFKKVISQATEPNIEQQIQERLSHLYQYEHLLFLNTKVSITEMKRFFYKEHAGVLNEGENLNVKTIFREPDFIKKETKTFTPAEKGTIMHTILQHLDLHQIESEEDVHHLLRSLEEKNILHAEELNTVRKSSILKFVNSDLCKRMKVSNEIKKEVPFVMGLKPSEIYPEETGLDTEEVILVHGIVDCFFEENGSYILVDYKTDFIDEKNVETKKAEYKIQLDVYKKAIERATGKDVKEMILYFFNASKAVSINV